MKDQNADSREDILTRLMAQYDEALATGTPAAELDESAAQLDPKLATEWEGAKSCLELLDRARRQSPRPKGDSEQAAAARPRFLVRFRIERELGHGGLGIVYLAEDPRLGRKVAIKIPRFDAIADQGLRRRFLREAEAAARLSHPHLVTLHEVGEDGSVCYLVSEYCPGPTLAAWLRQRAAPMGARQAAAVALRLAEAVHHAHSRGVLHRDIKPSNVLLDVVAPGAGPIVEGEHPEVSPKLTDFGMAKLLEQESGETRTGAIVGTMAYMSPEQAEGRVDELDVRTDVYSLGALLYEMLLGAAPYVGKTDVDTLRQLIASEPVAPRRIRADLPRDLEAITLRCMARRPADRYATAHELAVDLRRFLRHQPTVARPLTGWQIAAKWARRRPAFAALVIVSVACAAIVIAGGALVNVRLSHHTEELRQAVNAREEAVTAKEDALTAARIHDDEARRAYPGDMRLAQQAWNDGRIADAASLLDKHRPGASEPDHRTFAWHYLRPLCHLDERPLDVRSGPVYVCRYSPDGRILATAGEDGQVRLWEAATGALERTWTAHDQGINSVSFSPDGRWLTTTSKDAGAVWEVDSGRLVRRPEMGGGKALALAFTPDGQTLIVGGAVAFMELWDTADWSPREQMGGDGKPIRMLAVSPDGTTLASTSDDATIRLWDLSNRGEIVALEGHTRDVTAIAFSHDGKELASASEDACVKVWDVAGHRQKMSFENNRGHVHDVAFTPDDRWVVSADRDGYAQFWSAGSRGRALWSRNSKLFSIAIAPDGRQMATGGDDGVVHIWNELAEPGRIQIAKEDPGRAVDLSPDSRFVALGDYSGNIRLYDLATRKLLKQFSAHGDRAIDDIRFSRRGNLLVTAGKDNAIRLWRFPELTLLHTLQGHQDRMWNLSVSPDGASLASCSEDRTIKVWDTASGALRHDLRPGDVCHDVSFSPDGRLLAVGCADNKVHVWHVADGTVSAVLAGHDDRVDAIAWSPDGSLLATGGIDDFLFVWDVQARAPVGRIVTHQRPITTIAFSPDGKTLASGGSQGTVKLWDVASREEILVLNGHGTTISKVGFAEGGDLLYSLGAGKQCDLFVWPAR